MSEYFPEPKSVGASVKVELELSNYKKKEFQTMQHELIHWILLKGLI